MESHTRRRFVIGTSGIVMTALAGCSTGSAEGGTPTATEEHGDEHTDGHDGQDHETTQTTDDHSHHDGHHHEEVPDAPVSHAEVGMLSQDGEYHFSPHVVWIEEGATVTFVNESGSHSAAAYSTANDRPQRIPESAASFDTGLLTGVGATVEHTFDTPGVYDYYCAPHEQLGMIGSIIVGHPDHHDQPGLAEPQDSLSSAVREKLTTLNEVERQALDTAHEE